MPIISHSNSPQWIKEEVFSIYENEAKNQDIRPLRIGFINYMPDKAFIATEEDFIKPIIEAAGGLQFEIIFLKSKSIKRSVEIQEYINNHYQEINLEILKQCDILIQSGANEIGENNEGLDFKNSDFAKEVIKNYKLAQKAQVTTQVASCSASHIIAHNLYDISVERISDKSNYKKLMGVYPHYVTKNSKNNFITKNLNSEFNIIYARNYAISSEEIKNHKILKPLIVSSEKIGTFKGEAQKETHLFYDPKELFFGFTGHPEYQKFAILKEYLRDIGIYYRDSENINLPEIPPNYFTKKGFEQMKKFIEEVKKIAKIRSKIKSEIKSKNYEDLEKIYQFDKENRPKIDNSIYDEVIQSWKDTGDKIWARIFNATYQLTGFDAGQKITNKRGVSKHEFPLDAFG